MTRAIPSDFEQQVLLTVWRLDDEAYGASVRDELETRTGREIAQGAVYVTLMRLEKKGLLSSRMDDSAKAETGRVRRYFQLTPAAMARLRETRRDLISLWDGIGASLDEA